jgi:hypothetical protein
MYKLTHYSAAQLIQEHHEELHSYLVRQTRCPDTAPEIRLNRIANITLSQHH